MRKQDELVQLIHALTTNEKRYFKLFSRLQPGSKKHEQLFDELLKAEYGIEVQYDKYKDKEGIERHLTINHEAERIIFEKKMVTNIQKELTKYAVSKYKEREMNKIDNNLDDYIKSIDNNE